MVVKRSICFRMLRSILFSEEMTEAEIELLGENDLFLKISKEIKKDSKQCKEDLVRK